MLSFRQGPGPCWGNPTTRVALPYRVQTWHWRSVRGSFCRDLRSFRGNGETTSASVATGLEPGATSRTDTTVSGRVDDLLPSSWSVHRRNLCNRLLHRKHWWRLRSYWFGSCMHVWSNKPHRCYGLWHNRQFASQQLEHSLEEPVHATGSSDERSWKLRSYCFGSCMYVWFGHLWFLSIKFHHITCF